VAFCFGEAYAILRPDDQLTALEVKDMECSIEDNLARCTCSYEPCSRKGKCCECIQYHWRMRQLPGCLFPPEAERTYDRSLAHFIRIYSQR
jgi:hypothetical protein